MKIDRPGAIIELNAIDLKRIEADEKFRAKLFERALDLSDRTERTVCVYVADFYDEWVAVHGDTDEDKFEIEMLELIAKAKGGAQ